MTHLDGLDHLDHLVLAGPDLAALVAEFADRSGVTPVRGGRHTGLGTANHLVGLGGHRYLELIGPDPDQPEPASARPFGIDELTSNRLVTWAVRPDDLDAILSRAKQAGHDTGPAMPMSRRTPDGELLQWRLTRPRGVVPFLIDWGSSTHPTAAGLPEVDLAAFSISDPEPESVRQQLAALGLTVRVDAADEPSLTAVLTTPGGQLTL